MFNNFTDLDSDTNLDYLFGVWYLIITRPAPETQFYSKLSLETQFKKALILGTRFVSKNCTLNISR